MILGSTTLAAPEPANPRMTWVQWVLYALDTGLGDLGRAAKADVERAMAGHVLSEAVLLGTYPKRD